MSGVKRVAAEVAVEYKGKERERGSEGDREKCRGRGGKQEAGRGGG